jgi:hypothetical protein
MTRRKYERLGDEGAVEDGVEFWEESTTMLEEGTPLGGHVLYGRLAVLTPACIAETTTHSITFLMYLGERY